MSKTELKFLVGVIAVSVIVLCAIHYAYGDVRYFGKYFTISFPGEPQVKSKTVGSPYGDVLLTAAEYYRPSFWLLAQHALIPDQMFVEQTHKDLAIRMLAPVEEASKFGIPHMDIVSLGTDEKGSGFWVYFIANGHSFFSFILVDQPHAWLLCIMDYEKEHIKESLEFLESFKPIRRRMK